MKVHRQDADQPGYRERHSVRRRHLHHAEVVQLHQRRHGRRQDEQERRLAVRRRARRQVRAHVDRNSEVLEVIVCHVRSTGSGLVVDLRDRLDEDRSDEDVVADHREEAVHHVQRDRLVLDRQAEDGVDDRLEDMLLLDDRDDAEEDLGAPEARASKKAQEHHRG